MHYDGLWENKKLSGAIRRFDWTKTPWEDLVNKGSNFVGFFEIPSTYLPMHSIISAAPYGRQLRIDSNQSFLWSGEKLTTLGTLIIAIMA